MKFRDTVSQASRLWGEDDRNIDGALAQHYGFTEEELDFIINYDIKYRTGGEQS